MLTKKKNIFYFHLFTYKQISAVFGQPRFLSVLNSLFQVFRFFFKHIYEAYHWYHPELRFGRCLFKFARKQYPELRQRLSYENVRKFTFRMFDDIYTYVSDVMNDGQSDEWINRNRIAAKISEISDEPELRQYSDDAAKLENRINERRQQQQFIEQSEYGRHRPMASRRMDGRPLRRVAYMAPRSFRMSRANSFSRQIEESPSIMSLLKMPQMHPMDNNDDPNTSDELTELNENSLEELLDFESVLYESLGIDRKQSKEYSPINCGKEYSVHFIKRLIIGFLTGEIFK